MSRRTSTIASTSSFVLVVLAALAAPAAARDRLTLTRSIDIGDAGAKDLLQVRGMLCAASARAVRLRCVSTRSGQTLLDLGDARAEQRTTRFRRWKSLGAWLSPAGHHVVQAYGFRRALLVRFVDAGARRVVRRVIVEDSGGRPRLLALSRDGRRAVLLWAQGIGRGAGVAHLALDGNAPRLLSSTRLGPISARSMRAGERLYVRLRVPTATSRYGVQRIGCFDAPSGKRCGETGFSPGAKYVYGASIAAGKLFAVDDKSRLHVFALPGLRRLRAVSLARRSPRGYLPPLHAGARLFVLSASLARLDGDGRRARRRVALRSWYRGSMALVDGGATLALAHRRGIELRDARTLALRRTLPLDDPWQVVTLRADSQGALLAHVQRRVGRSVESLVRVYRRRGAGGLALRGLSPGTGVFSAGRLIARTGMAPSPLVAGAKLALDVLRPGCMPATLRVTVRRRGKTPVDLSRLRCVKRPALPQPAHGALPTGAATAGAKHTIAQLLSATPRSRALPRLGYRASFVAAGGRLYGVGTRAGVVVAIDPRRTRAVWRVALAPLLRRIYGGRDPVRRFPTTAIPVELVAATPSLGLIYGAVSQARRSARFALASRDGSLRWHHLASRTLSFEANLPGGKNTPPGRVAGGLLWARTYYTLVGYDLRDGRRVIELDTGRSDGELWRGPRVGAGDTLVYLKSAGHSSGHLVGLRLTDLAPRFRRRVAPRQSLALSRDRRRVLLLGRGSVRAFALPSGKAGASARLAGSLGDLPLLQRGAMLYVCGNHRSQLYALDARSLALRFSFARAGDPCPALVGPRALLVSGDRNARYLLDRRSGALHAQPPGRYGDLTHSRAFFRDGGGALCFAFHDRVDCYP
ncbi:MAG: hypothetical protein KC503_21845 [Myxococcales bacterium]|nr:hypothetical protein [Myxococcales bacterium]